MPDKPRLEKLDAPLAMAYEAWDEAGDDRDQDAGISVTIRFEGDLAPIEDAGFETDAVTGDEALGVVRFRDLPSLTRLSGVLRIAAGRPRTPDLDTAVPDVRARASSPGSVGSGGDGLWHVEVASGDLTGAPDATGEGVVVAVIDTGIDVTHPAFMRQMEPTRKTRILRVWDQGLRPGSVAEGPDASRLASSRTYGVEYDEGEINAALNGGPAIDHKDCEGHGTHVAATAAGGRRFPPDPAHGGDASFVGVAPEADIVAVKLLDVPDEIRYRTAAGFGAEVGWTARFRDAVLYCLRTARHLGKPVVVNMSFGSTSAPGDGLDEDARWTDGLMDPASPADATHFPKSAVLVTTAGNSGDPKRREMAKITVPSGGSITVPFELIDTRGGLDEKWQECAKKEYKPSMGVDFWYRRTTPHTAITFALQLPDQPDSSDPMGVGGHLGWGFVPRLGPRPVARVAPSERVYRANVFHNGNPAVRHPSGASIRRHEVNLWLRPKESGGTIAYHPGIYEVEIVAPEDTVVWAVCDQRAWARKKGVAFIVGKKMQNGDSPHGNIEVITESTAVDTLGQHAITVAAYDDTGGNSGDPEHHHIAPFSSRGPLRDYSGGSEPRIADKPDVAAPGVEINAAHGADTEEGLAPPTAAWSAGVRFVEKKGTSMAAPMVAGVVALLLEKDEDLSTTDVRGLLRGEARPGVDPSSGDAHDRAYGSGMVDALDSHEHVP